MADDAEVYQKTVDDRTIILGPRSYYMQGFKAPQWMDLRVGFFLSITDVTLDDSTTGALAETIAIPGGHRIMAGSNRYWIGIRNKGTTIPTGNDATFVGFTNRYTIGRDWMGDTVLSSSDGGVGTTNTNFWRPNNSAKPWYSFMMLDSIPRGSGGRSGAALAQHFPQSAAQVATGYAVLLGIRLTRDHPDSRVITAYVKSTDDSADMLYSNAPTKELIRDTIIGWPDSQVIGPSQLIHVPDAFYFYWPFTKSRLRIHSVGVLKAA